MSAPQNVQSAIRHAKLATPSQVSSRSVATDELRSAEGIAPSDAIRALQITALGGSPLVVNMRPTRASKKAMRNPIVTLPAKKIIIYSLTVELAWSARGELLCGDAGRDGLSPGTRCENECPQNRGGG